MTTATPTRQLRFVVLGNVFAPLPASAVFLYGVHAYIEAGDRLGMDTSMWGLSGLGAVFYWAAFLLNLVLLTIGALVDAEKRRSFARVAFSVSNGALTALTLTSIDGLGESPDRILTGYMLASGLLLAAALAWLWAATRPAPAPAA